MNRFLLLPLSLAILAFAGCKDEETGSQAAQDAPAAATAETSKPAAKKTRGQSVYFVCQMTSDRVNYLSEMIEMTKPRTNEEMAAAFKAKVESLDRTYYPLGEGDALTYSCTSDTDVRKMMNYALDLRGQSADISTPFRTVTGWKP